MFKGFYQGFYKLQSFGKMKCVFNVIILPSRVMLTSIIAASPIPAALAQYNALCKTQLFSNSIGKRYKATACNLIGPSDVNSGGHDAATDNDDEKRNTINVNINKGNVHYRERHIKRISDDDNVNNINGIKFDIDERKRLQEQNTRISIGMSKLTSTVERIDSNSYHDNSQKQMFKYNNLKSTNYNDNNNNNEVNIENKFTKNPTLISLVLNNRKLSFYDTYNGPTAEQFYRWQKRHYGIRPLREQGQQNAEDVLFDMFRNEDTGFISMGKFLAALKTTGIRRTDPRIREMMDNLKKLHNLTNFETGSSAETQNLNRETFTSVVSPNIVLIAKAFRQQFIIPDFTSFVKDIEDIYWKCKPNNSGKVADYIPQLSRYSPESWGVSICTIDGQRYSIGDVDVPFTVQSCSKPITYAIALEKLGAQVVHSYVGQEPSGRNFNELILDDNNKPHNPMINAGAIITCSLIQSLIRPEMTAAEKFDYTMSWFKRLSGDETIGFNNAVFLSEREAADRNYALGFYMRENKCYPKRTNLKEVMDFYFQCCSMEATCETMSVIAATLANGGICPTTEEKVLQPEVVRDVLSIMHSCGTYDYSGQFAFKVGLPAKSGVSGGIMLVIPNVMGIFTWSPPLDKLGNSGRGLQFSEELVNIFNFHRYDNLKHASNKKDPRKHRYETKGLSIVNLLFSAASGDVTALRRHRLSGMDIRLADYDGRTALHLAASEGHLDCVQFLLEQCHVPHNPKDRWGNQPIDEARNFGHEKIVEYLEEFEKRLDTKEEVETAAVKNIIDADEEIRQDNLHQGFKKQNSPKPIKTESNNIVGPTDDTTRPGF